MLLQRRRALTLAAFILYPAIAFFLLKCAPFQGKGLIQFIDYLNSEMERPFSVSWSSSSIKVLFIGTAVYAQTYYHSTTGCSQLNKEKKKYGVGVTYGGKVGDVKKQRRIIRAPQTYGYAHKTCPCCWKAGKYGELMAAETAKIKGTLATTDDRYTQTQNAINTKTDPRFS